MDLARMRLEYETAGISESNFAADPFQQFSEWFDAAVAAEVYEPNAMVVSTVDQDGQPWSRYVLLKGVSDAGFDFFTNYESNKSAQIGDRPSASITFGWLELHRQVNIAGTVERVSEADSNAYWAVRTRGSQLGGWASPQSRPIAGRSELTDRYEEVEQRFGDQDVPRPPHWGGWRVVPHTVEFWQGRQNRMHDRLRYVRSDPNSWDLIRLAP
ncbi:MAG: pyridoxamine 5'-phosphate oxidase [Acidimicrobiales bacterium]